jgi:hypothetical protein
MNRSVKFIADIMQRASKVAAAASHFCNLEAQITNEKVFLSTNPELCAHVQANFVNLIGCLSGM